MPITVYEKVGREFTLGEGRVEDTVQFLVTGAFSEPEVVAAIEATVPAVFNNLFFLNTSARELAFGLWEGSANYGIPTAGTEVPSQLGLPGTAPPPPAPPAANEPLGPEWSFTTSGGTQHILFSKQTKQQETGTTPVPAPDNKNAIGASRNGPEGCDIVISRFELTKTAKYPQISLNFVRAMVDLTGKTNDDTFLGVFQAGEALYLGADGNYRDNEGWSIVHRFSMAPNRPKKNADSTNPLDRVEANGHDYIWVKFRTDESNGGAVQQPDSVYVERVYDEGDFDKLGM